MEHLLKITEEQRQLTLMALAHLAVKHPGFESALSEIARLMDQPIDGRPQGFEAFKQIFMVGR